jgi:hypothetical protein
MRKGKHWSTKTRSGTTTTVMACDRGTLYETFETDMVGSTKDIDEVENVICNAAI